MFPPESTSSPDARGSERTFKGVGVAPGIAIGPVFVYATPDLSIEPAEIAPEAVGEEMERLERAIRRSERELRKITAFAREKLGEASAEIFEAQILLLNDEAMRDALAEHIRQQHRAADYAVETAFDAIRRRMQTSASEYLRDRAGDIVDVKNRLLRNLQYGRAVSNIAENHIVVADTLTAADVLLFSKRNALGIATDFGGPTSHVSIMARALGIPAVVSLHGLSKELVGGEPLALDGFNGRVVVHPGESMRAGFEARKESYRITVEERRGLVGLPAETRDGARITLRANIELEEELDLMAKKGAEGIGLFRTEMLLLARGRPLDEEEQLAVYSATVRAASPHPTTFRLLDLGGDKMLPMAHREHNPFLGWRGVRVLLDKPDILKPQLRAILRAACEGPVRVLIPMVSSLEEVHRMRAIWNDVVASLKADGLDHRADVPLGVMVEVPAVALAAERYAAEVDFLSIGSNDLTQFVLAVDRGNDLVSGRYRELHPVILQLIRQTVQAGERYNIPVSLCGEMGGSPRVAPLLVGLGLRELSASPVFLPDLKHAIRSTTLAKAEALANAALEQADAQSVRTLAAQWMREHIPELSPFFDTDHDEAEKHRVG